MLTEEERERRIKEKVQQGLTPAAAAAAVANQEAEDEARSPEEAVRRSARNVARSFNEAVRRAQFFGHQLEKMLEAADESGIELDLELESFATPDIRSRIQYLEYAVASSDEAAKSKAVEPKEEPETSPEQPAKPKNKGGK